jgi:hypothetical protein
MTKGVILPLESYRLAQYAVPIPCYVCETDNTCDSEFCIFCSAPMALAHQANNQGIHPRMIAVVGASGAGKTVYLGMLMDMLSRQPQNIQLLARGAFSINLQQTTIASLARCEFPRKTPNEPDRWNWVHCQVRRKQQRRPMELIMPDMAGEAVLEEVNHPHTYRVVRSFLKKSTGAMVLIDAVKLKEDTREQDYFTMKLLSYLSELGEDPEHSWADRPVTLILTKADQVEECLENPDEYARTHASGLWQHCRERFSRHRFFGVSVAGSCVCRDSITDGRVQVPLRIEPRGIVEPFEWLLEHLLTKKEKE